MYTDHCAIVQVLFVKEHVYDTRSVCIFCTYIQVRLKLHLCSGTQYMELLTDCICVLIQVKWPEVTAFSQTAAATQMKKSALQPTDITDDRKPGTPCKHTSKECLSPVDLRT